MNDDLYMILTNSLPILAEISYGYAAVTDHEGIRLKTVNSKGEEISSLEGTKYILAAEAHRRGEAIAGRSQLMPEAESWAIPIGPYVICCNNMTNTILMKQIKEDLYNALPYISKVVDGETSFYDLRENKLITVVEKGQIREYPLDENRRKRVVKNKPQVTNSEIVEGALVVNIPVTRDYCLIINNQATVKKQQQLYNELKKSRSLRYTLDDLIGESKSMQDIKRLISRISDGIFNILITGETGTGKEIAAQSIHALSSRAEKPFIAINCGALPTNLIESELFGYKQGAFTGASPGGQAGIFEKANGGTVLLDEIGDMDIQLQTKLLRVLQEKSITRIGSVEPIQLNIRIIASTNKNLEEAIKEKTFRQDLYFRLNVVNINIPALRERKEDIPLLVNHFMKKYEQETGKKLLGVSPEAMSLLQKYNWSGNVRELENCIERVFSFLSSDEKILSAHLPGYILNALEINECNDIDMKAAVSATEKNIIAKALIITGGDKKQAAKLLGISETTLWRKMK